MLEKPVVNNIKGPDGSNLAAKFGTALTITYWDLRCLIAAEKRLNNNMDDLKKELVDQRLSDRYKSLHKQELIEDLIHLVSDLNKRISSIASIDEILALLPERLIKKEAAKAIRNILEQYCYYKPSKSMPISSDISPFVN